MTTAGAGPSTSAEATHVVVVNWNAAEETLACLRALFATAPKPGAIHVVDNGSADGSAERVATEFPDVRLHRLPENRGFAGGANVGVAAALKEGAAAVWFLNNDARPAKDALGRLVAAAARRRDVGLFGPKIFRDLKSRRLWCCGVAFRFGPNLAALLGFDRVDDGSFDVEKEPESLTGCGLLARREVFDAIGLLDEGYFAYVEDADFCARARKAGFRLLYVPEAILEHPGGGSSGGGYGPGRKYLTTHGAARFLRRHGTFALWSAFLIFDVLLWPFLYVSAACGGRGLAARAKAAGAIDGLFGRPPDLRWLARRTKAQRAAGGRSAPS
jgi:GT2 family glycosyltransferase